MLLNPFAMGPDRPSGLFQRRRFRSRSLPQRPPRLLGVPRIGHSHDSCYHGKLARAICMIRALAEEGRG